MLLFTLTIVTKIVIKKVENDEMEKHPGPKSLLSVAKLCTTSCKSIFTENFFRFEAQTERETVNCSRRLRDFLTQKFRCKHKQKHYKIRKIS